MNEENLIEEAKELQNGNKKLMKKSLRMIISFFTLFVISVVLFFTLQENKFFIFNLNRTFYNVPSPVIAELFSMFFIAIIIIGFIIYVFFTIRLIKRRKLSDSSQLLETKKFERIYNLADIFSIVPIFLVVVMVVNGFFYSFAQVEGVSMQPTFCDNDAVIIQYVDEYQKNDIVIIQQNDMYLIKRLVAVPGDTIRVDETGVYVNGTQIESRMGSIILKYTEFVIPDGYYYVLGDNRTNSEDSRVFGLKSEEYMLGKVIYKISTNSCPIE